MSEWDIERITDVAKITIGIIGFLVLMGLFAQCDIINTKENNAARLKCVAAGHTPCECMGHLPRECQP
jgi:hypothetical protein